MDGVGGETALIYCLLCLVFFLEFGFVSLVWGHNLRFSILLNFIMNVYEIQPLEVSRNKTPNRQKTKQNKKQGKNKKTKTKEQAKNNLSARLVLRILNSRN